MKKIILYLVVFVLSLNANTNKSLMIAVGNGSVIHDVSILVLKEAYSSIGINMKTKIVPSQRSLKDVNNGLYDGDATRINGINKTFKNLIQIPVEINFLEAYVFSNKKDLKIDNWESLRKYKIVGVLGVRYVKENLDKHNIKAKYVAKFSQAMELISKNRADLAIFTYIVGKSTIRKTNNKDIKIIGKRLIKLPLYHYIHKKNKNIAKKLEAALLKMKTNGRINEIRKIYMKEHNY